MADVLDVEIALNELHCLINELAEVLQESRKNER